MSNLRAGRVCPHPPVWIGLNLQMLFSITQFVPCGLEITFMWAQMSTDEHEGTKLLCMSSAWTSNVPWTQRQGLHSHIYHSYQLEVQKNAKNVPTFCSNWAVYSLRKCRWPLPPRLALQPYRRLVGLSQHMWLGLHTELIKNTLLMTRLLILITPGRGCKAIKRWHQETSIWKKTRKHFQDTEEKETRQEKKKVN